MAQFNGKILYICVVLLLNRCVFSLGEKVEKLTAIVHGIIAGIPIPFPLPNPDACKDSGLQCPLASGKSASYVATLPILSEYPAVSVMKVVCRCVCLLNNVLWLDIDLKYL